MEEGGGAGVGGFGCRDNGPALRSPSQEVILCLSLFLPIWQRPEVSPGSTAAAAADTEAFVATSVHARACKWGPSEIPPHMIL